RLRLRWRRHWKAQEAALARREQELFAGRHRLHREAEALQKARAALTQAQLRFNGEAELGPRELPQGGGEGGLAPPQGGACPDRGQAERARHTRQMEARAAALAQTERSLHEQQRQWQQRQAALAREIEGLEARVRNQRDKLLAIGPPAPHAAAPPAECP